MYDYWKMMVIQSHRFLNVRSQRIKKYYIYFYFCKKERNILGECTVCGKKGLFLKINSHGRCNKCELAYQKYMITQQIEETLQQNAQEMARNVAQLQKEELLFNEAKDYFNQLVHLVSIIKKDITVNNDPIIRLNDIPLYQEKIRFCDELYNLLDNYNNYKYLQKIFKQNITYESELDKQLHLGRIESLSLSVFVNRPNFFDKAIEDLKQSSITHKKRCQITINCIENDANFQNVLLSLEGYTINPSDKKYPKLKLSDIEGIKFTTITAKTNLDKLGTFVSIDTETTGLIPSQSEVIEVAAVYFDHWIPTRKFEILLKPKKNIPEKIQSLTGITDDMVQNSPSFFQVIPCLEDFVGKSNIVGHNLHFDLKFLYKNGYNFFSQKRKYYDTLELARKILKGPSKKWDKELESYEIDYDKYFDVDNHKLDTLCKYYHIRFNANSHRALSDCLATGFLFKKLVEEKIASKTI